MKPGSPPWIQIDTGILSQPRILWLAELMHTTPVHGVGLVICFWAAVFNTFKSQVIPKSRIHEVWPHSVDFLIDTGFLHNSPNSEAYLVPDWPDFAFSWLVEEERVRIRREQDLARQRKRRANLGGRVADETISPYRVRKHQGLRKAPVRVRERFIEEIKKIEK